MADMEYEEFDGSENGNENEEQTETSQEDPEDAGGRNINAMLNAKLEVQVVLGGSRMPISQIIRLGRGSVIELNKKIGEPVEIVLNDLVVARGDLVKVPGDRIGVNLTEIVKEHMPEG